MNRKYLQAWWVCVTADWDKPLTLSDQLALADFLEDEVLKLRESSDNVLDRLPSEEADAVLDQLLSSHFGPTEEG